MRIAAHVAPFYQDQAAIDAARLAMMRHTIFGEPAPPSPATADRVSYPQLRVAGCYDPVAFRAFWTINGMVRPPDEVYTDPEGTREHFGSVVLGLYDKQGRLIHVGQAGSGFDRKTLSEIWALLKNLQTKVNPFHGPVEALRKVHWLKPELVAEIKFSEWTHETNEGGLKLRAPVFLGLRQDKSPRDCTFAEATTEVQAIEGAG